VVATARPPHYLQDHSRGLENGGFVLAIAPTHV
jgi:hypothetical protein